VTLVAFAAERRAAVLSINIADSRGTQQQTRHTLLQRSTDGTDQTD